MLFEGPPGTGKTLTARILARRCGRPMVQVKTEKIVSKWYGEATKNLSKVFDACEALEAVIFIDEVDAIATKRFDAQIGADRERVETVQANRPVVDRQAHLLWAGAGGQRGDVRLPPGRRQRALDPQQTAILGQRRRQRRWIAQIDAAKAVA